MNRLKAPNMTVSITLVEWLADCCVHIDGPVPNRPQYFQAYKKLDRCNWREPSREQKKEYTRV